MINEDNIEYLWDDDTADMSTKITELYWKYDEIKQRELQITDLQFSWENENYLDFFQNLKEGLGKVEALVIIGYSFPFFNRRIDAEMFRLMFRLEKIYIQDSQPESIKESMVEFVKKSNGSGSSIEYILKNNLEQFVFPKELEV